MASREMPRPNNNERSEEYNPARLGSQLDKYSHREFRVPKGQEWAFTLINQIPDKQKNIVTTFIAELPPKQRQKVAEHLSNLVEAARDRILMSKYPEVEIQNCIAETTRWMSVNEDKDKEKD